MSPVASVVVAVRGNPGALRGLVTALRGQTLPPAQIELIVVDNHRRPVIMQATFADAAVPHVLVHEPRPGLSRARNAGIRHARGDYILITDPDSRPRPEWAKSLVDAMVATGASCAGGRAVPPLVGSPPQALDNTLVPWFVPPEWPDQATDLRPPYWLVGCNLAFRRTDPPTLFAEQLGAIGRRHTSCEDLEIVARYEERGDRVVVVPDAVVDRAVHPADLRLRSIAARALWHGVSVARLIRMRHGIEIYDSYRARDVIGSSGGAAAVLLGLCRIVGFRLERLRLALLRSPAAIAPGMERAEHVEGVGHGQ